MVMVASFQVSFCVLVNSLMVYFLFENSLVFFLLVFYKGT